MRRSAGRPIPIEVSILEAGIALEQSGVSEFHGFRLAKEIRDRAGARALTAHGTLYRALDRMERAGWLASHWEDPAFAALDGRPRRRLYRVTLAGARVLATSADAERPGARPLATRLTG